MTPIDEFDVDDGSETKVRPAGTDVMSKGGPNGATFFFANPGAAA